MSKQQLRKLTQPFHRASYLYFYNATLGFGIIVPGKPTNQHERFMPVGTCCADISHLTKLPLQLQISNQNNKKPQLHCLPVGSGNSLQIVVKITGAAAAPLQTLFPSQDTAYMLYVAECRILGFCSSSWRPIHPIHQIVPYCSSECKVPLQPVTTLLEPLVSHRQPPLLLMPSSASCSS